MQQQPGPPPGQTPLAQPYNPAVQEGMMEGLHPAAQYAYDRAVQQGVHPQEALQTAQQMQQEMVERKTQGGPVNTFVPLSANLENENNEWGTPADLDPRCPMCGGPGVHMGNLGRREHFRCRNCGMDFSQASEPSENEGSVLR